MGKIADKKRATNLEELGQLLGRMFDKEGAAQALRVKLRPTDVVISPFGKSGTTWLQQIVHTLRTQGDMDFDDISRVVPWIETSVSLGIDLNAEQKANPRAFKSHLDWHKMPKGARYIVSLRDPKDALYSAYRFMEGWFVEPGAIALDDFARNSFIASGNYWTHLLSWWEVRDRPDVLLLAFEHMKDDLPGTIRRVADFCCIPLDGELFALTQEHASLEFMQAHKDRFDDLMMRELSERAAGLPPGSDSAKVRKGDVGEHKEHIGPEIAAELDDVWRREITAKAGPTDYGALLAELA